MAELPNTAGRCRRVVLCALLALIGLGGPAGFGQMPPEGPMLGPDARPLPAAGPAMPAGSVGQGWPMPPAASSARMPGPPGAAAPAVPAEEMVLDVRVEGNLTITREKILQKIRTRVGRPYDDEQVQQDVRELNKMGVFVYVRTFKQRVQGGVVVIFQVTERPLLKDVLIVGNDTFLTSSLKKEAELKVGDAADPFAVENGRRKIEEFYKGKGYSKVRVTVLEGNKVGDLRAVFLVNEGPRQRVFWVNFVGNRFVSSARLKALIDSHPPWFYLFSGEVDRKQIDEDVKKLTAYYRAFGFYFARVGRFLEFNEKQNWLTITFVIEEGPRYSIRNISFLGNKKIDTARLTEKLKLLSGQYYDQNQQNLDLQKLRDEYGGDGYVFAKIEADNRLLDEPGMLDIVYNVDEGARYRVGRINIEIKGESPHTQILPVLNRLSFKPGDIVDTRELTASERRLKSAQLFKVEPQKGVEPKIVYSPPDDDKDTAIAGQRRTSYYRVPGGEAPLPPGEAYVNVRLTAEWLEPEPAAPPQNPVYGPAGYPPPTFQGQTFQQPAYPQPAFQGQTFQQPADTTRVPMGQPYSPPNGFYSGQPPQNYSAPQPAPAGRPMYYNPPAAAPYGVPAAAPPSAYRQTTYYRGPDGDGYVEVNPAAWQRSDPAPPQNAPDPRAANPQPTFQGQIFHRAGYELNDSWGQPQPQPQGESWPAATSGGNGSYAAQPQNYSGPPPAPAATAMYYPPAAVAPYGAPAAAPPSGYSSAPAYGVPPAPNYGAPAGAGPPYAYPSLPATPVLPGTAGGNDAGTAGGSPGLYMPGGPAANRLDHGYMVPAEMAAAGDLFSNPEPTMVPTPTGDPVRDLPMRIPLEETQTGRLMFGVGINSDAGLVGNVTLDEQNFDWRRLPESWEDITEGHAFRGAGQRFRVDLVPGTQVQRYSVSFDEPYAGFLENKPVGLGLNGSYYQRIYTEWREGRAGGGVSLQYQFTHDLRGNVHFQGQDVNITNPEYPVPALLDVLGHNALYTFGASLQHDTRDNPFLASEGHLLSATFDETIGTFQYPRAALEFSQYFRLFQRADRSGKHVLSFTLKAGWSGDDTPIFERYYAGGFSSIRGFAFRGVTPRDPVFGMGVGGDFQMLSTAQYLFPITADDMLRGVVFVDAGTVEPSIGNWSDVVRVAPGFGLRISIPMMGPAPIALDFAFPISSEAGDQRQIFSFFVGVGR